MATTVEPTLAEVLSAIRKISGKDALMEGVTIVDIPRVPVPAQMLNLTFTGGGFPQGRMVEYFGAESAGKTSAALITVVGFQKADSRPVFFLDAEGTYDPIWAEKLGVDNSRVILWRPDSSTAEEIFEKILAVAKSDDVSLIVIDSFPALVPQNMEEKDMTQLTMAGISAPLSRFSIKMAKVLLKHNTVSVLGLNQIRDSMASYGDPLSTPGGHAWKHFCSVRLHVKSTPVDDSGKDQPDKSDTATGVRVSTFLRKNKTGPREWKNVSFTLSFLGGFNPKLDLVDAGLTLGLIEQKGSSYSFIDTDTGVVTKGFGKKAFVEKLDGDALKKLEEMVLAYSKPARS